MSEWCSKWIARSSAPSRQIAVIEVVNARHQAEGVLVVD